MSASQRSNLAVSVVPWCYNRPSSRNAAYAYACLHANIPQVSHDRADVAMDTRCARQHHNLKTPTFHQELHHTGFLAHCHQTYHGDLPVALSSAL